VTHRVISTILRHDAKQTSYKIALLRALNDAVLAYPDLRFDGRDVAVPLRSLAESWVAYYWPFVAADAPIDQGVRSRLGERERHDLSFRPHLTELRRQWEAIYGPSDAAGGWHLVEHLRVPRHRDGYGPVFLKTYAATLKQVRTALAQPIQYAGPGRWSVFAKPAALGARKDVAAVPGARADDVCVVVPADLWQAFRDVSLWVEALCIHEWSLFTERVAENAPRGVAYALLTERPYNRLPLHWERNQVDLLLAEGVRFTCPWTGRPLAPGGYDLDHVVPVSVHPFHELWNLVPADPRFNQHGKRARLAGDETLRRAEPRLAATYASYARAAELDRALRADVALRFARAAAGPPEIARAVVDLVASIADARNLARF
jgi:hypothetical protein